MKSSSTNTAAVASSIKRTGSATNLSSVEQDQFCSGDSSGGFLLVSATTPSSLTSPPSPAASATSYKSSYSGTSIKRTGSANNIASANFLLDKYHDRSSPFSRGGSTKKTSELIASLSKSGVMMFVDDKALSPPAPPHHQSSRLSPAQFFRSSKRSSSSSRCPSEEPRPCVVLPEARTTCDAGKASPPLSRSLPPSPQHSPPRSRKVTFLPLISACPLHQLLPLLTMSLLHFLSVCLCLTVCLFLSSTGHTVSRALV